MDWILYLSAFGLVAFAVWMFVYEWRHLRHRSAYMHCTCRECAKRARAGAAKKIGRNIGVIRG